MTRRREYRLRGMPERISIRQFQTSCDQSHCRHRNQPRRPTRPPRSARRSILLLLQPLPQSPLQPLAEPRRHLQHPLIAIQLDHIPRPRQHRRAARARPKMFIHRQTQRPIHFPIHVIGNLAPHLFTVQRIVVHHGLFPFSNGSRLNQPCSHPAASRSRNISRARNSRVFTEATVMPSASAVS